MKSLTRLDRWLLGSVVFSIFAVVIINFIGSYGHIYVEGLRYGEVGVEDRLMPIGIDGMLLCLGLANVLAARFDRGHWLLRSALAFGVAGTIGANAAYGASWGLTGGLLSTWSPVALFVCVESGLYVFRIVVEAEAKVKIPRPYTRRKPKGDPESGDGEVPVPVIRGTVDDLRSLQELESAA